MSRLKDVTTPVPRVLLSVTLAEPAPSGSTGTSRLRQGCSHLHRHHSVQAALSYAYLADPNEYRAILRNLLHLGGHVAYTAKAITITLDRPDSPRVARALQLLTEELNATPAVMPTDPRPLTYQLAEA